MRGLNNGEPVFTDCELPDDVFGRVNEGARILMSGLDYGAPCWRPVRSASCSPAWIRWFPSI